MRILFTLLLLLPFAVSAASSSSDYAGVEKLLARSGLTAESMAKSGPGRVEWAKTKYPGLSPQALERLNTLFNPATLYREFVRITADSFSKADIERLNAIPGGAAVDKAEGERLNQKLAAWADALASSKKVADDRMYAIVAEDIIFHGPLDGPDYLERLRKFVDGAADDKRITSDPAYAAALHALMLYEASRKFDNPKTGVQYWMMRVDLAPADCQVDPAEYAAKRFGYSVREAASKPREQATCAEIKLFRDTVNASITDEVRRYRELEQKFFQAYVKPSAAS